MNYLIYSASGLLFIAVVARLSRWLKPSPLSPITVTVIFYLMLFGLGPLVYNPMYAGGGMPFYISAADEWELFPMVLLLLSGLGSGALLFILCANTRRYDLGRSTQLFRQVRLNPTVSKIAIGFALAALVCQLVGVGLSNVWYRQVYLIYDHILLKKVAGPLTLMSLPTLGLVAAQQEISPFVSRLGTILFGGFVVLLAALSTRTFAAAPLLFFLGKFLGSPTVPNAMKKIGISAILAPILVVFPLIMRQAPNQGVAALPENVLNIVGLGNKTYSIWNGDYYHIVLNSLFISVPETRTTYESGALNNLAYFKTGVNPLPGFATDFAETLVMLNPVTPMTAVGDLLRTGLVFGFIYYAVVGVVFASVEASLRGGHGPGLVRLGQAGIGLMFTVISVQYPLRNASRLIYYIIFVEIGLWLFGQFVPKDRASYKLA